ncbi:MAG TPA: hypothetical protein EYN76_06830 [Candidatus Marinimicrobia bacterium]|nr:hypothetical protein [Candidatus Neomarinimicrobiota bacterium]
MVQNRENKATPAVLKDRRLEILGILIITTSLLVFVSLIGYSPSEDPGISPNVQIENPLGILGVYLSYFFLVTPHLYYPFWELFGVGSASVKRN